MGAPASFSLSPTYVVWGVIIKEGESALFQDFLLQGLRKFWSFKFQWVGDSICELDGIHLLQATFRLLVCFQRRY